MEDFGIVPLEVMASGRPVIAFARGGATETVVDGVTGLLFHEQTPQSLAAAVQRFEAEGVRGTPADFRAHVELFGRDVFLAKMQAFIDAEIARAGLVPAQAGA